MKIDNQDAQEAVADLYLPEKERFYRRKEIDSRKLISYSIPLTYGWLLKRIIGSFLIMMLRKKTWKHRNI